MKKLISSTLFILALLLTLQSCGDDESCEFKSITNEWMPEGKVGEEYLAEVTYDITCSYTSKLCEVTDGHLPPGIDMGTDGKITGVPTSSGTFTFDATVTMCFDVSATQYTNCPSKTKELSIVVVE